jgi:uncharacterized membrane protein YeaQ/YmgE (transglycosylase-associated protein family)
MSKGEFKNCPFCAEQIKSAAIYCKHCHQQLSSDSNAHGSGLGALNDQQNSTQHEVSSNNPNSCPVCRQADSVQKVATVIDGGISGSVGFGMMTQFSHPTNVYGGITASTSSTNLASRLSVGIPAAQYKFRWILLGSIAGFWIAEAVIFRNDNNPFSIMFALFIGVIPGAVLGIIFGFVYKAMDAFGLRASIAKHHDVRAQIRESYYCFRDDVVFNSKSHGRPEELIQRLLS